MKTSGWVWRGAAVLTVIYLAASCANSKTGSYQDPNVHGRAFYTGIAQQAFSYEGPGRNPVIVIHGLLGSKLVDRRDGSNIWGHFALAEMLAGDKFARLAHPMAENTPLFKLHSDVQPDGLLDKSHIQVLGFSIDYEGYENVVRVLEKAGYVPDLRPLPPEKHFHSQFIFYYDWRRDIAENAVRLGKFIQEKRAVLQNCYERLYGLKNYDVRFDIVGHSMGGLVARYFLRYGDTLLPERETELPRPTWAGAKHIDRVVIIAAPNAGYPDTLIELTGGLQLSPAAPFYPKTVIGTFPSYYQMLPDLESGSVQLAGSAAPVDYFDIAVWKKYRWGLADPGQDEWLKMLLPAVKTPEERFRIALNHLDKCLRRARQFKRAMRLPLEAPSHLALFLIAGDSLRTNSKLSLQPATGILTVAERDAGDGKIPAVSARFDLRTVDNWRPFLVSPIAWSAVYHLPGGHMGIMNGNVFESNFLYLLLSTPTLRQREAERARAER